MENKKSFTQYVDKILGNILRKHGFKGKGLEYKKNVGGYTYFLDVQKHRYANEFCINMGVNPAFLRTPPFAAASYISKRLTSDENEIPGWWSYESEPLEKKMEKASDFFFQSSEGLVFFEQFEEMPKPLESFFSFNELEEFQSDIEKKTQELFDVINKRLGDRTLFSGYYSLMARIYIHLKKFEKAKIFVDLNRRWNNSRFTEEDKKEGAPLFLSYGTIMKMQKELEEELEKAIINK